MSPAELIETLDNLIQRNNTEDVLLGTWRCDVLVNELGDRVVRALLRETAAGPRL